MDMRLTEHFTLEEMVRSATATKRGIDNTPTAEVVDNLGALCRNVLEPARQAFGGAITVTSGYRSKALNAAVGGKANSQHLVGEAADIQVRSGLRRLWKIIRDRGVYDQLLYERSGKSVWIHVSYTRYGGNRHQAIDNYED